MSRSIPHIASCEHNTDSLFCKLQNRLIMEKIAADILPTVLELRANAAVEKKTPEGVY